MKLSFIKMDQPSLNKQVMQMNTWNLCVQIKKLVKTMCTLLAGITIPAVVFKSMDYMLTSCIDGRAADYTGGITQTLSQSSMFVLSISKWIIILMGIVALFKFIKTGDNKSLWREMLHLVVGWIMICILHLLPVYVPIALRALGLI